MSSVEWKIGVRYLWAGWRSHIVSFIALISLLGIALGVATLITVMSVMNGFENELKEKILSSLSHVVIETLYTPFSHWERVGEEVSEHPEVEAWAPYIEKEVMIMNDRQAMGVQLRGVEPVAEAEVSRFANFFQSGRFSELRSGEYGVLIGESLAERLGVEVGDKIALVTSDMRMTAVGAIPRFKRFEVKGIFSMGMHLYDSRLIMIHIDDAARLFRMQGEVSGLRVRLQESERAPEVVTQIVSRLGRGYWGIDWTKRHANLFGAIDLQKRVMFIILMLVVAVAAFNLIATMVMIVREKRGDIAILRTLGLTSRGVLKIFMLLGTLIGVVGISIGLVLGMTLSVMMESIVETIQRLIGVELLAQDVYMISTLPGKIDPVDIFLIVLLTLLLSFSATLYPAWRAAKIAPAAALNRE